MTTLPGRNRRPNGHSHEVDLTPGEAQCPYCGQPISRAEFKEIRARIETEERARITKVEQTLKDRFAREQQQAQVKAQAEVAKAKRDAASAAAAQIKALRSTQEEAITQRLAAQRETLAKKLDEAIGAERAKHFEEKLVLEQQVEAMKRRLQQRTAFQIGEKPEADLYESMTLLCPGDRVTRTPRGMRGADVLIEILAPNREVAGKILLDSKAHARWQSAFTRKLAADKTAENADFALLVSSVLPANEQQICIRDSVIVTVPERVPALVSLLRKIIVDNFVLKLSVERREMKADRLFDFIISPACTDLFDRLLQLTRDLEALGVAEEKSHKTTWSRRAELVQGVMGVHDQFVRTVADLIGGGSIESVLEEEAPV